MDFLDYTVFVGRHALFPETSTVFFFKFSFLVPGRELENTTDQTKILIPISDTNAFPPFLLHLKFLFPSKLFCMYFWGVNKPIFTNHRRVAVVQEE